MDNQIQFPQFSVNTVDSPFRWISEQVENTLHQHLRSLQNGSSHLPLFANLIEDNPGYDLIPQGPVEHPDPQRQNDSYISERDIDQTCYDNIDMDVDLSGLRYASKGMVCKVEVIHTMIPLVTLMFAR